MKEIHPQVSVSFIKCDRNSIGTSEKVDPIWRKDAWNGGMAEYPKHRMAENAYIERFQLLQLRWIIPDNTYWQIGPQNVVNLQSLCSKG